jgi:SOS-response transcriptional repressor LexA
MSLTQIQRRLYYYLIKHLTDHGYQPSMHEMADAMGWKSKNRAYQVLRRLQAAGLIEMAGRGRSVKLLKFKVVLVPSE